jgi:hypothetical protein
VTSVQYLLLKYGPDCAEGITDMWTCFSMLDCRALQEELPVGCEDAELAAWEMCPELISLCADGAVSNGPDECEADASNCLDGHVYSVHCIDGVCTCSIDGVEVGAFPGEGDACITSDFDEAIVTECDFPPDVFGPF